MVIDSDARKSQTYLVLELHFKWTCHKCVQIVPWKWRFRFSR